MIWILLAVYLVTSWWAFRTNLRRWFTYVGVEWEGVLFALLGFVPVAGPVAAIYFAIDSQDPAVPTWLLRIGGVK